MVMYNLAIIYGCTNEFLPGDTEDLLNEIFKLFLLMINCAKCTSYPSTCNTKSIC